jgi:FkbM family methyltransferase
MMDTTVHNLKHELSYLRNMAIRPKAYEYRGVKLPDRHVPALHSVRRSIYRGEYQAPEIQAVTSVIEPGDVVVEFGAGIGVVSMAIALRLGDSSRLTSYEANAKLASAYAALAAANGVNPTLVNAVVGRQTGESAFFVDNDFVSSSAIDRGRNAVATRVPMVGIEDVFADKRPTAIMFDIEGAEAEVLDVRFPDHVQVVCGEVHPHIIGHARTSALVKSILAQGFELCLLRHCGYVFSFVRGRPVPKAT